MSVQNDSYSIAYLIAVFFGGFGVATKLFSILIDFDQKPMVGSYLMSITSIVCVMMCFVMFSVDCLIYMHATIFGKVKSAESKRKDGIDTLFGDEHGSRTKSAKKNLVKKK